MYLSAVLYLASARAACQDPNMERGNSLLTQLQSSARHVIIVDDDDSRTGHIHRKFAIDYLPEGILKIGEYGPKDIMFSEVSAGSYIQQGRAVDVQKNELRSWFEHRGIYFFAMLASTDFSEMTKSFHAGHLRVRSLPGKRAVLAVSGVRHHKYTDLEATVDVASRLPSSLEVTTVVGESRVSRHRERYIYYQSSVLP